MPVPRDYVGQSRLNRLEAWIWMRRKLAHDYKDMKFHDARDQEWGVNREGLLKLIHSYIGDVKEEYRPRFNYLSYLYQCVRQLKPSNVLEIGVQNGRSTFAILQGLEDNGHGVLHSIDVIPASKWLIAPLVPFSLKHRWRYHEGASEWRIGEVLYHYPKIDLMFHDAAHDREQQLREISQVWNRGAQMVVVDYHPEAHFETYADSLNPKPTKVLDGALIR